MKNSVITVLLILLPVFMAVSNTTRDLKQPPEYSTEKIKKHILLYINIERINAEMPSLVINRKLGSAAQWHSDYMAETKQLFHQANKKDMHDVQQRVLYFGEKIDRYAELLAFSYSVNIGERPFVKEKDSSGEYIDFGKISVCWLTETEIAMEMMKHILKDASYKSYMSNEKLNSIGGGISGGMSNDLNGFYGSFAIVEKTGLLKLKLKVKSAKEIIKKIENGKEAEEIVVMYDIAGFIEPKAALLIINSSGIYRTIDSPVVNGRIFFRIDDKFRSALAADEKIYIASYDKENDMYYPLMRIDEIK